LHLQCHIGSDTLSLALEGATVTGIDISAASLKLAKQLADETGLNARFIKSNIYDLKDNLQEQFDVVYTSQGVLCWLKDIEEWGKIVAHFLKPGGTFYIMDSHPVLMSADHSKDKNFEFSVSYFNRRKAILWEEEGPDYADPNYIVKSKTFEWNWPLSDIINAIINAGLQINFVNEYPKIFYKAYPTMQQDENGWWYLPELKDDFPMIFTLNATKPK